MEITKYLRISRKVFINFKINWVRRRQEGTNSLETKTSLISNKRVIDP